MDEKKFWSGFDRMMKLIESMGLVVLVIGPIAGILMLLMSDMALRVVGIVIILASAFLALYHFSFAYVMHALRFSCLAKHTEVQES